MANGLSSPDTGVRIAPPEVKLPEPKNFTSLREFQKPITTEPPKFEEPTTTDPKMDQLMADIFAQGKVKNPEEAVKQVEKNLPQEAKKTQGFIAKIREWFRNLFSNLFR